MTHLEEILVVEDDPSIRECLVQLLQSEGYQVTSVTNGQEALDYLSSSPRPCLIFLDLMMPVMDGFTFLQKLQEMENHCHIPVVVSSAVADRKVLKGPVAVLTKPYQIESILKLAHQYCGTKK